MGIRISSASFQFIQNRTTPIPTSISVSMNSHCSPSRRNHWSRSLSSVMWEITVPVWRLSKKRSDRECSFA